MSCFFSQYNFSMSVSAQSKNNFKVFIFIFKVYCMSDCQQQIVSDSHTETDLWLRTVNESSRKKAVWFWSTDKEYILYQHPAITDWLIDIQALLK